MKEYKMFEYMPYYLKESYKGVAHFQALTAKIQQLHALCDALKDHGSIKDYDKVKQLCAT